MAGLVMSGEIIKDKRVVLDGKEVIIKSIDYVTEEEALQEIQEAKDNVKNNKDNQEFAYNNCMDGCAGWCDGNQLVEETALDEILSKKEKLLK